MKEYFKKLINNFIELIKELPEDYEAIKKKNEMERNKINKDYEKYKENKQNK